MRAPVETLVLVLALAVQVSAQSLSTNVDSSTQGSTGPQVRSDRTGDSAAAVARAARDAQLSLNLSRYDRMSHIAMVAHFLGFPLTALGAAQGEGELSQMTALAGAVLVIGGAALPSLASYRTRRALQEHGDTLANPHPWRPLAIGGASMAASPIPGTIALFYGIGGPSEKAQPWLIGMGAMLTFGEIEWVYGSIRSQVFVHRARRMHRDAMVERGHGTGRGS